MKAQALRHIKSGSQYDSYFEKATLINLDLPKADVFQTLNFMENIVCDTLNHTAKIAAVLIGKDLSETCQNIFNFIYQHIQYNPDQFGIEQLRTPNRTWADRKTGVDCDCYSIFISSILTNLSIPHSYRITKYNGKNHFQHVYIIVPKNGKKASNWRDSYYVIDPVLDGYNNEKNFSEKHDKTMKIPHQILNGVHDAPNMISFGQEFNYLNGLGNIEDRFLDATKAHLQNTLEQLNRNPGVFSAVVSPLIFKDQIQYVLENWKDPIAREGALEEMVEMEELGEYGHENNAMNGLGFFFPIKRKSTISPTGARKKVNYLRKRRFTQRRVVPATIKRGTLQKEEQFNMSCSCYMKGGLNGYYEQYTMGGLDGFFKRVWRGVKNTAKKVASSVKSTASKVSSAVKTVASKVAETAKKAGKAIVRYNPLTIAARNGLLIVMKLNMFGLAKKLKYGYLNEGQARARNMSLIEWNKLKATISRMEGLFKNIGGNPENLKKAILTGKAGGLGEVVTAGASTAAASGLVATIVSWLKNIDFNKLFNTVKSATGLIKKTTPQTTTLPTPTIYSSAPIIQNKSTDPVAYDVNLPEFTVKADKPKAKSNMGLILGLAAAGIGAAILFKKKPKPSLKGVIESVSI